MTSAGYDHRCAVQQRLHKRSLVTSADLEDLVSTNVQHRIDTAGAVVQVVYCESTETLCGKTLLVFSAGLHYSGHSVVLSRWLVLVLNITDHKVPFIRAENVNSTYS